MYVKKKGQVSFEFIMIFVFVVVITTLSIYLFGAYLISFQNEKITQERDDFAKSILDEFSLALDSQEGYSREVIIPTMFMDKYNVSANQTTGYLILYELQSQKDEAFFYFIEGAPQFNYTVLGTGEGKFVIYTNTSTVFDGREL